MKTAVRVIQVLVGLLFVVSGLVKANDPIGLSYKMQEFFELWLAGFSTGSFVPRALSVLHNATLALSIGMITMEIVTGVALLLGWRKKAVLWLLLLLIVFFTFLTGYAYLSGKFTNCGCFGDCLPITPLTSFLKDLALLAMIVFLLSKQRYVQPILSPAARSLLLILTVAVSLGLQWYVLRYLPLADCLPFKQGNNLPAQMKPLPGSIADSFAIRFIYEKGGRQYEFAPEELPADFATYQFIDRKQTLVRNGNAEAAVKGFTLTNDTKDEITGNTINFADTVFSKPKALLFFALAFDDAKWITAAKSVVARAGQAGVPVYVISPNYQQAAAAFAEKGMANLSFYNTDFTVVRTVARTNPTLVLLQNGTVEKKWSRHGMEAAATYLIQ